MNYYFVSKFIHKNKLWVGPLLIILGLGFSIFGVKYIKISTILLLCLAINMITFFIFFIIQLIGYEGNDLIFLLILIVGWFIGVLLSIFLKSKNKYFVIIIAGCIGFFIGALVFIIGLGLLKLMGSSWGYWLNVIIFTVLSGAVGKEMPSYTILICTAFIGSFSIVKGISLFTGNYPSESLIIAYNQLKEWNALIDLVNPGIFVGYLCSIIVLFVLSFIFQLYLNKNLNDGDIIEDEIMLNERINQIN